MFPSAELEGDAAVIVADVDAEGFGVVIVLCTFWLDGGGGAGVSSALSSSLISRPCSAGARPRTRPMQSSHAKMASGRA